MLKHAKKRWMMKETDMLIPLILETKLCAEQHQPHSLRPLFSFWNHLVSIT